jgi:hypothetical protein
MRIMFPGPAVPASDGSVSYRALVDGETVVCQFSLKALTDVDPSHTEVIPRYQFEASKSRLLAIAARKIMSGEVSNGMVRIDETDLPDA